MPLIKTDAGIIDITGRVAGTIYKRDASGLHMTAKSRYVRKPRTQRQIDQNDWYCALKRNEAKGGPAKPDDKEDPDPSALMIYQPLSLSFARTRSFTEPSFGPVDPTPEQAGNVHTWILNNWPYWIVMPEFTIEILKRMFLKKLWENLFTWGLAYPDALVETQQWLLQHGARCYAASRLEMALASVSWIAALAVVVYLLAFWGKQYDTHFFTPGESIVRIAGRFCWARLIARPGKKMYDYIIGPPLPLEPSNVTRQTSSLGEPVHNLEWGELFQEVVEWPLNWAVYCWKDMPIVFRYTAYGIKDGRFRTKLGPLENSYYRLPVGWTLSGNPWDFINHIYPF
jgi:hypothetical protein